MKIVIPMSGVGQRFVDAGYTEPKPLIKLNDGRRIVEHVLDMFQEPDDEFVFVCNSDHIEKTDMAKILLALKPKARIISIAPHKMGPVWTVMAAAPWIEDHEEVIVAYCDGTLRWARSAFIEHVNFYELDGCILTHNGFHPHTLSPTKMAFVKCGWNLEPVGLVYEVKEKASYTDQPHNEHASSGVYWFKRGDVMKKAFQTMIDTGDQAFNGEYYCTLAFNIMIRQGHSVDYYDTPKVAILGTPHEVRNFEAWRTIVKNPFITNEDDVLRCYRYWKEYHQ